MLGDSLDKLATLPDNYVDAIVTDPPYGLKFMGHKWDYSVPSVELWQQVLRVLKPGGHVLSFGGTRTYHRMVVNIEDAGFEIRDQLQWIYGSGFPKSMDISKAFDKSLAMEREIIGQQNYTTPNIKGNSFNSDDVSVRGRLAANITAPASNQAKQWEGWGTALKPANEPIVLARKPLIGTVVQNIEAYGVGGINIDACRIGTEQRSYKGMSVNKPEVGTFRDDNWVPKDISVEVSGRFPANVIFDGEAGRLLDIQSGTLKSGDSKGFKGEYSANVYAPYAHNQIDPNTIYADSGGASRFFYCAKASKSERGTGNTHPTVKPVKLMEYLIKLITPPDGIVLDPFAGSMTTGIACVKLGMSFIMVERDADSYNMGKVRLQNYIAKLKANKVT